jgi:YspA, cpYpsA-related SLOG family
MNTVETTYGPCVQPPEIFVLVTGYREWQDRGVVARELAEIASRHTNAECITLVHGACHGADTIAENEALDLGWTAIRVPAEWKRIGRAAGPARNQLMIDRYSPHYVLAFVHPASRGTLDCIERVRVASKRKDSRLIAMRITTHA